jgi:hypothetical protein
MNLFRITAARERLMQSKITSEPADRKVTQTRREALKKFGRYAAAAPAAMVLLQPRVSDAHARWRSHGWFRHGRDRRHEAY